MFKCYSPHPIWNNKLHCRLHYSSPFPHFRQRRFNCSAFLTAAYHGSQCELYVLWTTSLQIPHFPATNMVIRDSLWCYSAFCRLQCKATQLVYYLKLL